MIFIVKCISFVMEVLKAFNILLVNDMVPITELYHYIEFMQRKESAPAFDIRFCFQPIFAEYTLLFYQKIQPEFAEQTLIRRFKSNH